ncbi:hypothetical protein [Microbacterium kyungheense]|uniref:SIR2-like protein n=1 Tax=Microbacterium kyungheense TaxID=1263636 RepID=A0A543EAL0_9MICO|nr:hypothetical protein [Microbacterium kyungheense]TQM18621.1 hypothetical protein FB391_3752 [Microbacterium kyungheense]
MGSSYILGAGFSRAVSSSMPLLTELGLRVRDGDEEIANRVSAHEIEAFESWMSQASTPQPYRDRAENLEAKGLYLRATREISAILRDEVITASSRPLPGWLLDLVELWHATRASVSTFNYDTLVELAVRRACLYDANSRLIVPWPTVINFAPSGSAGRTFGEDGRDATWTSFDLLKLHGSINWYWVPGDDSSATLERVPLFDGEREEERNFAPARWLPGKEPYIVPPVALKSAFYGGPITSHLWQSASHAIGEAAEIVLMGYSVPTTDLTTLGLLRESLSRRSHIRITVCDLYPDTVVQRVRNVLPPSAEVEIEVFDGPNAIERFTTDRLLRAREETVRRVRTKLASRPSAPLGVSASEGMMRQVTAVTRDGQTVTCTTSPEFHAGSWPRLTDLKAEDSIGPSFVVPAHTLDSTLDGATDLRVVDRDSSARVWTTFGETIADEEWIVLAAGLPKQDFKPV